MRRHTHRLTILAALMFGVAASITACGGEQLAEQLGVPRAANTVMLAALAYLDATGLPRGKLLEALDASFAKKPKLIPVNRKIFEAATAWCRDHLQEAGQ